MKKIPVVDKKGDQIGTVLFTAEETPLPTFIKTNDKVYYLVSSGIQHYLELEVVFRTLFCP